MEMKNNICTIIVSLIYIVSSLEAKSESGKVADLFSNVDFALTLNRYIEPAWNKNVLTSPLNLFISLVTLLPGAKGNTERQIKSILSINNVTNNDILGQMKEFLLYVKSMDYNLNAANRLYYDKRVTLLQSYKKVIRKYLGFSIRKIDFKKNSKEMVAQINKWVKKSTKNKIKSIINQLPENLNLMIVNAIYFNAFWLTSFNSTNTKPSYFTTASGESTLIDMMKMVKPQTKFNYADNNILGYQFLELPYSNEGISMFILLPHENKSLSNIVNNLTCEDIKNDIREMVQTNLAEISIPKIIIKKHYDLNEILEIMGLTDLFQNNADLSAMTKQKGIKIDKIVHQTFLEINEEGTEASATTSAILSVKSSYKLELNFIANKPFLFFIFDRKNEQILFMGRFVNPNDS